MGVGKGSGGTPYPSNSRVHRTLGDAFKPGAAFLAATPISVEIPIAGDTDLRLYFKASQAGTLAFEFMRPYPTDTVYDTNALADVPVVAGTEVLSDIPVKGESRLKVTFTPGATPGTITYADVAHRTGA